MAVQTDFVKICDKELNHKHTQCRTVSIAYKKYRTTATQTCNLVEPSQSISATLHTSTPCKKPRLDDSYNSITEDDMDDKDPAYQPSFDSSFVEESFDLNRGHREEKFVLYKSCFRELFKECRSCNKFCSVELSHRNGTMAQITQSCYFCDQTYKWKSK